MESALTIPSLALAPSRELPRNGGPHRGLLRGDRMAKQVIKVPPLKAGMRLTFEVIAEESALVASVRSDPTQPPRKTRSPRARTDAHAQPESPAHVQTDAQPESQARPQSSEQPESHALAESSSRVEPNAQSESQSPSESETAPAVQESAVPSGTPDAVNTVAPDTPTSHEHAEAIPHAPGSPAVNRPPALHGSYVWSATRGPKRSHVIALVAAAAVVIVVVAFPRRPQAPATIVEPVAPEFPDARIVARAIPASAQATPKTPAADVMRSARPANIAAAPPSPKIAKVSVPTRSETAKRLEAEKDDPIGRAAATRSDGAVAAALVSTNISSDAIPSESVRTEPVPVAIAGPLVTLTGCLEMSTDEEDFRLNGTEGSDAPKSRSWRTGFMRRRTTPVALEAARSLGLKSSVGHRIAATGVLSGTTMRVDSIRIVSSACE